MKKALLILLILPNLLLAQSAFMLFNDDISVVNDIYTDANVLWLATDSGVVKVTVQPESYQFFLDQRFTRIKKRGSIVYAATDTSGFFVYNGNTWQQFRRQDGLPSDTINDFDIASNGDVWIATEKGLSLYDGNSFTTYTPFINNQISAVATYGNRLYAGNKSFTEPIKIRIGTNWLDAPSLPSVNNRIVHLNTDGNARLYAIGFSGIFRIDILNTWDTLSLSVGMDMSKNGTGVAFHNKKDLFITIPLTDTIKNPFEIFSGAIITALHSDSASNSFWCALRNDDITVLGRYFKTDNETYEELSTNALTAGFSADGSFFKQSEGQVFRGLSIQDEYLVYTNGSFLSGWQGTGATRSTTFHTFFHDALPQWVIGPASNNRNSSSYFKKYNRVWKVTQAQIDDHIANYFRSNYQAHEVILNWPGNGDVQAGEEEFIAPFVDLNANGIYEPMLGEYPEIRGDQAIFMVSNTSGGYAPFNQQNLDLESRILAYAYDSSNTPLHNTIFIHQQIVSKSRTYGVLDQGLLQDFEIGDPFDDAVGADSARSMIYSFNGDLNDQGPFGNGHGINPPAIGLVTLSQPLDGAMSYNSSVFNLPINDNQIYQLLQRKFPDGTPIRLDSIGGTGYAPGSSNTITGFQFNDRVNWYGTAPVNSNARYTGIITHNNIGPGNDVCLDYAYVYAPTKNPGDLFGAVDSLEKRC